MISDKATGCSSAKLEASSSIDKLPNKFSKEISGRLLFW